jgi:hypothetical protein
MAVTALALVAFAPPILAKASKEVYQLPPLLVVDPTPNYGRADGNEPDPAPRHGMVLHGYRYDSLNGSSWATEELADAAKACGDQLKLPPEAVRGGNTEQPVTHDFWLVHSEPEALYLSRTITLTELNQCVALATTELSLGRLMFAGDRVTVTRLENGRWWSPSTLPIKEGYGYLGNEFFRPVDFDQLRRRPHTRTSKPHGPLGVDRKALCFNGSGGMIYTQECRLDDRGRWHGLLLRKHIFHTGTVDEGMEVDYLHTDALIDGRLFEWDRRITLAK